MCWPRRLISPTPAPPVRCRRGGCLRGARLRKGRALWRGSRVQPGLPRRQLALSGATAAAKSNWPLAVRSAEQRLASSQMAFRWRFALTTKARAANAMAVQLILAMQHAAAAWRARRRRPHRRRRRRRRPQPGLPRRRSLQHGGGMV